MLKMILSWIKATPYGMPIIAIIVIICAVGGVSSYFFFGLAHDNPIEQQAEDIIEDAIGLPSGVLDLSPFDGKNPK